MGALYEDVEKFFGDIFAYYGRFLARYPVVFILLSLLTSCLLGMGLLSLEYETSVEKLYTPMFSPAFKDQERLSYIFTDATAENFSAHQQIFLDTYGSIIVTGLKEGDNVLTEGGIGEIKSLCNSIEELTLESHDRGHKYHDLCAKSKGECVVDGKDLLDTLANNACLPNTTSTEDLDDLREVIILLCMYFI